MKILLLKYRNIGDVLLITPLISNLKTYYPEAQIDVSVNKGTESMLSLNPNVNKVIIYDRKFIKSLSLLKKLWKEIQFSFSFRRESYDIVINLTKSDRGNQIAWFSKALVRIGYINKNLIECQAALNLSMKEVKTLIINSFKSSFLKEEEKKDWIKNLD